MIIAVSGKKGSGKDTVAKIFQYFTLPKSARTISMEEWVHEFTYHEEIDNLSTFLENRSYAAKLKDVTSIILNVPRWQLELEEFKKKILPKCWNRWVLSSDIARSLHTSEAEAKGIIKFLKLHPDEYTLSYEAITIRQFLQTVGTDVMRDMIHPNAWINSMFTDYNVIGHTNVTALDDPAGKLLTTPNYPSWIVTDVRFENELAAIKKGIPGKMTDKKFDFRCSIRVERPEYLAETRDDRHTSETALDGYQNWDHVITNDCDLDQLAFKVHNLIKSDPGLQKYFHI